MSENIKYYPTYRNEDQTRALLINPAADGGLFLKLSTIKNGAHNLLGSITVEHRSVPHVLFEMTGGNASDEDLQEAVGLAKFVTEGVQTVENLAVLTRRTLLALHFALNPEAIPAAPEAEEEPAPGGCQGCRDLEDALTRPAAETMQDPGYDPNAEPMDDLGAINPDADEVPDTEPNIVAHLARENASLRQKLAAIQSLSNPDVVL